MCVGRGGDTGRNKGPVCPDSRVKAGLMTVSEAVMAFSRNRDRFIPASELATSARQRLRSHERRMDTISSDRLIQEMDDVERLGFKCC